MKNLIYLDNAATTALDKKVLKAIKPYLTEKFANASSTHSIGQEAKQALEKGRKIIAKSINCSADEIFFTSGGTESNNLALKGLFLANKLSNKKKNHIITTQVEHKSILNVCKELEKQGARITYLKADKKGFINLKELKKAITSKTILISIIHSNNEIGTIQDIEKIGKICSKKKVYFHTDACQSYTKSLTDVKKQKIDLMSLNAHKIHGPKGVGALFVKRGIKISPLLDGGGQERKLRSGTENIPGIIGFAEAANLAKKEHVNHMKKLQRKIIKNILKIPNTKLNGPLLESGKRICNNINISFKNIEGEAIQGYLDSYNVYVSTGSACASNELKKSHVLMAIGLSPLEANSSVRISLSRFNTEKEINKTIKILAKIVNKLRKITPVK
jgi:cysteine desulfurase